jgi:lipid-binding SYLF domain-containing protein
MDKFRNTRGWEAGVDANVAMATKGAGNQVDFTKMYDPIIAFVFDVKGAMADISLKGAKFTKINPK